MSIVESLSFSGEVEVLLDSNNKPVAISSLLQSISYNPDGTVSSISATNGVGTWVQSFTYTSGRVSSISRWIKQ